jgi:hypothetical protein
MAVPRPKKIGTELRDDDPAVDTTSVARGVPQPVAQEWREWSASDRATSYRLPPELRVELAARCDRLRLPQGHVVLAALASLLDESDDQLVAKTNRATQALTVGKRRTTNGRP